MAPNLPLTICFLNFKAYPIGTFRLTIMSKKDNRFSLGITQGVSDIIHFVARVRWSFNHNAFQIPKHSKFRHTFLVSFSPSTVFNIFIAKFFSQCMTSKVWHIIKSYEVEIQKCTNVSWWKYEIFTHMVHTHFHMHGLCCDPSLGLATKARACKGGG